MYNYKQSKKQVAIRFFTYGVLTIAVLVLSAIGILAVMGYQFNFGNNSLQQTALLQFNSGPSGASVTVDGKKISGNTATKTNVPAGSHTAVMSLAGYKDWQRTFTVSGGTVLWMNYSLLIPTTLKTTSIREFGTISSELTSPDKQYRLLTSSNKPDSLLLVNLLNPTSPSYVGSTVPADVLTKADDGSVGTLSVVSWDGGSRYVLLKHTYGANVEYLRYDRQNPTATKNISTVLGVTGINKIGFSDNSGNTFYALVGTDIRKLDIGAGTISQPLVQDVTQMYYNDSGETIAYAVKSGTGVVSIGVYRDAGGAVTTKTYAKAPTSLFVAYGEYYGYRYLASYHDGTVDLIQSPDTRSPEVVKSITVPGVQWLYFSPNGRFLVAQYGNSFMTYDLETQHAYNQTLGSDVNPTEFNWLDSYHLVTDAGGTISISDFDGTNQQNLGSAVDGSDVDLSNDSKWLFSVHDGPNGSIDLIRTALRVQ